MAEACGILLLQYDMSAAPKPAGETVAILAALRKPGTQGWNGAFVAVRTNGGTTVAVFENNRDFIGNNVTDAELSEMVEGFQSEGWLPMDREDVRLTAGV